MAKYRRTEAKHEGVGAQARRMCWHKRTFKNVSEGQEAIDEYAEYNARHNKPIQRMRVYTCSVCGQLHVGRVFEIKEDNNG
jgi:ribosomal protein L44E